MDNYEYIIASLPVLRQEDVKSDSLDAAGIVEEIRGQLSERDRAELDLLLEGYDPEHLDADFYRKALRDRSRFVRDWFSFDLDLRNTTVGFLNEQFGREDDLDKIFLPDVRGEEEEFPEEEAASRILTGGDILQREQGLDDLRWRKIDELTQMDWFNLDAILGFVARLKIIDRWLQLDPDSGRALFRRLVDEIRTTYDNKKQNITI